MKLKPGHIIICGAPRAGTTSLFRYLAAHPEVSGAGVKELNFFLGGGKPWQDIWKDEATCDDYLRNFGNPSDWTLEASPAYMHPCYAQQVAKRIHDLFPHARLLMLLRNPVDRLFSQYMGRRERAGQLPEGFLFRDFVRMLYDGDDPCRYGIDTDSLHLVREGLALGIYADILEVYLDFFPASQIYLDFTDHLGSDPGGVMAGICAWLGISSEYYRGFAFCAENKMIQPRSVALYRIALKLNRAMESVLNQAPMLRAGLRRLHHRLNAQLPSTGMDDETVGSLKMFYAPHHRRLRVLLRNHWPDMTMPDWLEEFS